MTPKEIEALLARKSRRKRLAEMLADPNDRSHGKWSGYKYGCRCERCVEAMRAYTRKYYAEHRDEINARTRKRRRALYEADPERVRELWRIKYYKRKARKEQK